MAEALRGLSRLRRGLAEELGAGLHHVAVTVADADASPSSYSALLGLDEAFRIDDETLTARVFAGDGFLFGVRHDEHHDKDRFSEFRTGLDHVAFGVPDRDTLHAFERELERVGGCVHAGRRDPLRTRCGLPRPRRHPGRVLPGTTRRSVRPMQGRL